MAYGRQFVCCGVASDGYGVYVVVCKKTTKGYV